MRAHATSAPKLIGLPLASIRLAVLVSFWVSTPAYAAHVSIQGRQIVVSGKPLFLKGINWNPVPKGGQQGNGGVHFRGFVESDSELMAAAGINAVRTYEPIIDTDVLDTLWRKGIYVLNTVYITGSSDPESVVKPVRLLKDHPAILMWVIGNEWNYNMLYSKLSFQEALDRVRSVARLIKSIDHTHPVASVYGQVPAIEQLKALEDVDVWGVTAYTGLSFGDLFDRWAASSDKPMFVAEYGADAYNAKTSSLDEADQAKATRVLTEEVVKNSVLDGGACSGGLVFELADEWWKDSKGSPEQHNKGGVAPGGGPFPDNTFNEEYWGLVSVDGTPRQAYAAYAAIGIPGVPASEKSRPNITGRYRAKACGANPGCIGNLGDCCPGKDNKFRDCCSAASKQLHAEQAEKARRPVDPDVTPNAHSHQTLWTAGKPPAHCEVDRVVPCCPDGRCGSCAGDQCCPSEGGSVTCPSASKALADGCIRPKLYDCIGRTGVLPENSTGSSQDQRRTELFHRLAPASSTTTPRPLPRTSPRGRHPAGRQPAAHFEAHTSAFTSMLHHEKASPSPPPSTTPGFFISLHTTMKAPFAPPVREPVRDPVGAWILGPEKASCVEVCKSAGGCMENSWPTDKHEFMRIAQSIGYDCFDLQEGGGKFDPSTQQGNCGWKWNGGRELLSASVEAGLSRCETAAPSFTRRFCPCKSKMGAGHERTQPQEPEVVMEKFPRGRWTFSERPSQQTQPASLFA